MTDLLTLSLRESPVTLRRKLIGGIFICFCLSVCFFEEEWILWTKQETLHAEVMMHYSLKHGSAFLFIFLLIGL